MAHCKLFWKWVNRGFCAELKALPPTMKSFQSNHHLVLCWLRECTMILSLIPMFRYNLPHQLQLMVLLWSMNARLLIWRFRLNTRSLLWLCFSLQATHGCYSSGFLCRIITGDVLLTGWSCSGGGSPEPSIPSKYQGLTVHELAHQLYTVQSQPKKKKKRLKTCAYTLLFSKRALEQCRD